MKQLRLIIFALIALMPFTGMPSNFRSVQNGNWSSTSTWNIWNGSAWVAAVAPPAYPNEVTVSHDVSLDVDLSGTDNGFRKLVVDADGNLTASASGPGSSVSLIVGNSDYLSVAGTMTIGGIQLKSGGTLLIKYTGEISVTGGPVSLAGLAIINGIISAEGASITVSGDVFGTGTISGFSYAGGSATIFGTSRSAGILDISGYYWSAATDASWFDPSNWSRSTMSGVTSGPMPNDTLTAVVPATVNGNVIIDQAYSVPGNEAKAYSLLIRPGKKLTVKPNSALTIINNLENQAGPDALVIEASSLGRASLIQPNKPESTVELYLTGSSNLNAMMYHFVSIPVEPSASNTSALFTGSYLYDFNTASNSWENLGSSTTTPLDSRKGFMVYSPVSEVTYEIKGKLNNGKFTALTTYAGSGYNLVPNPFTSAIDWEASGWTKTNIAGTIYIWPAGAASASENYASYNPSSGSIHGGRKEIAIGQSFIVQAISDSSELSMTNAVCTHVSPPFLKKEPLIENLLRIKSKAAINNAHDEIIVHFMENATTGFDPEFDGSKLQGGSDAPQFSSVAADNSELCINSMPFSSGETIVPLHFSFSKTGEISFTASELESFTAGISIYLEDLVQNNVVNLRQQPVYNFTYHPGDAVDRFRLRFNGSIGVYDRSEGNGRAFISNGKLFIEVPGMEGQLAKITVFNMMGQVISSTQAVMNGVARVEAPQGSGIYIVEATTAEKYFRIKVFNK